MVDERKRLNELNKMIKLKEKSINPLYKERTKLQNKIGLEERKKLIGKTFKYRNSYGSDDKWWLYAKVIGVSKYDYEILTIQKDNSGCIEIQIRDNSSISYYTPVASTVFDKEFDKLMKELKKKAVIKNG